MSGSENNPLADALNSTSKEHALEKAKISPIRSDLLLRLVHETVEGERPCTPRELKERIFLNIIFDRLFDVYEEDLYDAGYEEEEVARFEERLEQMTDEEIKSVLSLPKEVRRPLFERYRQEIENGSMRVEELVEQIRNDSMRFGFTLGYHVSMREIAPAGGEWSVDGDEIDDRDDMKMAYYSLDFENFYRKKPARYVYFIRAETGERSSHRLDQSNNWSRAPRLSVVARADLREIDETVEQLYKEFLPEIQKKTASGNILETV